MMMVMMMMMMIPSAIISSGPMDNVSFIMVWRQEVKLKY
jgi:hypothetical protein